MGVYVSHFTRNTETRRFKEQSLMALETWNTPEHVSGAVRISAPRSRGCSLPPLHRSKSHQTAPLISAPRSPTIHPAPVKSLHARSNLNSSAWLTPAVFNRSLTPGTHCLHGGRGAGLLRDCCGKKSASLLFCRGAEVAVWLDCTWYARIPQAVWLL